jgi:hypothetical protein
MEHRNIYTSKSQDKPHSTSEHARHTTQDFRQVVMPFAASRGYTKTEMIRYDKIPPAWRGAYTVYLLHFDTEIGSDNVRGRAQHYVGMVKGVGRYDLEKRLWCHRKGYANSSKLTRAFFELGISFRVGHVWTRVCPEFERMVKDVHNNRSLCEICQGLPFLEPMTFF